MIIVPALAEQHAAHKARMERFYGGPAPVVIPAPKPAAAEPIPVSELLEKYRVAFDSRENAPDPVKAKRIRADVALSEGVTVEAIMSDCRVSRTAFARQLAMWQVAANTNMSLSRIGQFFNRDHTTVIHAIRVMNEHTGENVRGLGTAANKASYNARWKRARKAGGAA